MGVSADVELGEVAIIGVVVVVIGWALYKAFGSIGSGLSAAWESIKTSAASINESIQQSGAAYQTSADAGFQQSNVGSGCPADNPLPFGGASD